MSISKNPLPIPLERIGVSDDQFAHHSCLHGEGHVNRVIYNTLVLSKCMGLQEFMVPAWCAAYLHDLARRHDGVCYEHGRWAVKEKWDECLPLFREAGLSPNDDSVVQDAVAIHCLPLEQANMHPVATLLKDADALDRCRLGDLDPRFLRLEYTAGHVKKAEKLFEATRRRHDWMSVWNVALPIYNPHLGMAQAILDNWKNEEEPHTRMVRRVKQGQHYDVAENLMKLSFESLKRRMERFPTLLQFMDDIEGSNYVQGGNPVSYMSPAAYAEFKKDGVWKSFWELNDEGKKAWHDTFNDSPLDGRAFTDHRLYGEKGRYVVHGIFDNEQIFGNVDRNLRKMYGNVKVFWKREVLNCSSFTINDNQVAMYVLPYQPALIEKLLVIYMVLNALSKLQLTDKGLMVLLPQLQWPRYIELQIHRQLTVGDVRSAIAV